MKDKVLNNSAILLSIVMPVYNSVRYINEAINSIVKQLEDDVELIIIDDGATDGTDRICREYESKYKNVVYKRVENGGISKARNIGLELASGQWIGFCDHDDLYSDDYISIMKGHIKEGGDLIKCGCVTKYQGKNKRDYIETFINKNVTLEKLFENYSEYEIIREYVWNGIYRLDIIRKCRLRFPEEVKYGFEDFYFNLKYLEHCTAIILEEKVLYIHFIRVGQSTSEICNVNKCYDYLQFLKQEKELIELFATREHWISYQKLAINTYVYLVCKMSQQYSFSFLKKMIVDFSEIPEINTVKPTLVEIVHNMKDKKKGVKFLLFNLHMYSLLILLQMGYNKVLYS